MLVRIDNSNTRTGLKPPDREPPLRGWHRMLACVAIALATTPVARTQNCSFSCPVGAMCACEDCGPCNSGNFQVGCVCVPVQGRTTCTVSNGDCRLHHCAMCASITGGRVCTTYQGCTGDSCPVSGCTGGSMAGAARRTLQAATDDAPLVEVLLPAEVPLDLNDIQFTLRNQGFEARSYSVTNRSREGLVALVTNWTVSDEDPRNPHARTITHAADSWETAGPFLPAGGADTVATSFFAAGYPVRRLTVEVAYAEFDGGERFGPRAECIYAKVFLPNRTSVFNAYRDILGEYKTGASQEQVDKFLARQPGLAWLKMARANHGFDYMLEQLERRRGLPSAIQTLPQ